MSSYYFRKASVVQLREYYGTRMHGRAYLKHSLVSHAPENSETGSKRILTFLLSDRVEGNMKVLAVTSAE